MTRTVDKLGKMFENMQDQDDLGKQALKQKTTDWKKLSLVQKR